MNQWGKGIYIYIYIHIRKYIFMPKAIFQSIMQESNNGIPDTTFQPLMHARALPIKVVLYSLFLSFVHFLPHFSYLSGNVQASWLKGPNRINPENMKARTLRQLKSFSTPTWLLPQTNADTQPFPSTNLCKDHRNRVLQTTVDVKEGKPASGPSADSEDMSVPSTRPKEASLQSSESNPVEETAPLAPHDPVHPNTDLHVSLDGPRDSASLQPCLKPKEIQDDIQCEKVEDTYKQQSFLVPEFEDRCPPGGSDSIVIYTTSLRGIRKTFEDCSTVRFLLESFRVMYSERDVSMHMEYREELWRTLGGRVVPPRVFIRGKYIGGADEVVGLHEKGLLQSLLQGIPLSPSNCPCKGCAGMRFVLCSNCDGSRKVMPEGRNDDVSSRCPECNENGLVKCSVCS